ncbi:beta-lactamase/transpeptidase-like protein [Xylariaceae sp. FL0016]|nr:beta-lactamase/transpeptidase-like protein [Xylariaceae sp. FL0016]
MYLLRNFATMRTRALLDCRPPGTIQRFVRAAGDLVAALESAIDGEIGGRWDGIDTAFSIGLVALDQPDKAVLVWEYHRLAADNYPIGSVWKVFTDLIPLKRGLDLDTLITEHILELAAEGSRIAWVDITERHLVSQMAGIPPNWFPHLNDSAYAPCGVIGLNGGCTKELHPVAQPGERPVYANIAFTLLIYAVQAVTEKSYSQLLGDLAVKPLELRSTMGSPGHDSAAVIPSTESSWGADFGDDAPLSGLSVFLHGILHRSVLHHAPRTTSPGPAYGYQSQIVVLDEDGVAVVVLTAGDPRALHGVYDAVRAKLVPAMDEVAREQAVRVGYPGRFLGGGGEWDSGAVVHVSVALDEDSLVLGGVERDGVDMMDAFEQIWAVAVGGFLAATPSEARMFPVDVRREEVVEMFGGATSKLVWEDWRIDWEMAPGENTDLPGHRLSTSNCLSWPFSDWLYYGPELLDRVAIACDAEIRGGAIHYAFFIALCYASIYSKCQPSS